MLIQILSDIKYMVFIEEFYVVEIAVFKGVKAIEKFCVK